MRHGIGIAFGFALCGTLVARADAAPDPPDPCIGKTEGAACKPPGAPMGACTWITNEERVILELFTDPRCENRGRLGRCLMCMSAMFLGDDATRRKRIASFIETGETRYAQMLIQYMYNKLSPECDAALGELSYRLAQAIDAHQRYGSSHQYSRAVECSPRLYPAYLALARSLWRDAHDFARTRALRALLALSRRLLNDDATASEWEAFGNEIATDARFEQLRRDSRYSVIRERFALGRRLASAKSTAPAFYCQPEWEKWIYYPADIKTGHYRKGCLPASGDTYCPEYFLKMRGDPPRGLQECKVK